MDQLKTYIEVEAGALPFRITNGLPEYALIYREKLNDYSFPKGHVEDRESLEGAAVRETLEESGLSVEILEYIDVFEYQVKEKRKDGSQFLAIRRVYSYLVSVVSEDVDFINPDKAEGNTSVLWLPFDQVYEKLSYDNVRKILELGNLKVLNSLNK